MSSMKNLSLYSVTALLVGGLTYFQLSKKQTMATDKLVELVEKETQEKPIVKMNNENTELRQPSSIKPDSQNEILKGLAHLRAQKFDSMESLMPEVNKISKQIFKSDFSSEEKAQFNAELNVMTSEKVQLLNVPKVVGAQYDPQKNIVTPIFEQK